MLRILEKECAARQIRTHILTGETKDRQQVTEAFQNDPAGCRFSPQPARRRHGPEPDHREQRGALRSVVEPGGGSAGH